MLVMSEDGTENVASGSKRLRQMELNFARCLVETVGHVRSDGKEKEGEEEMNIEVIDALVDSQEDARVAKIQESSNTKRKKRITLKQVAAKNTKMTDWLKRKDSIDSQEMLEKENVADDEEDWPEMDQPEDIVRKEIAKAKSRACRIGHMCRGMVNEIVDGVIPNSAVGKILESVMSRSWWRLRIEGVWRLIEDDKTLQKAIFKKMERQEKEKDCLLKAVEKEERLERRSAARGKWVRGNEERQLATLGEMMACLNMYTEELTKTDEMDWSLIEVEEHHYIEQRMSELGITESCTVKVKVIDFEDEMEFLDRILEELGDNDHDDESLSCSMGPELIDDMDWSPEVGDLSTSSGTSDPLEKDSVRLTLFSIVGRPGGSRKRPHDRRAGRWWTARGWYPVSRRSSPWRVGRRRTPVGPTSDTQRLMPGDAGKIVVDLDMNNYYFPGAEQLQNKVQVDSVVARKLAMMSGQTELLPRGAEVIKKVQVDKGVARELGFESGQKKLLPRCAGKTAAESDKITCGNGYWAPDSIVPGVRSTSHHEHGQGEGDGQVLGDVKVVQSQELPLTDSFIAGRYKPFQSIKVFWQGLCGELKGVHDHHQHQEASHNQEQDQALSVEEDQPPVQTDPAGGEGLLRQGHSMEGGDGHEEQAGGGGDGLQQLADHRARVGDGFQTEFRKISRARRK